MLKGCPAGSHIQTSTKQAGREQQASSSDTALLDNAAQLKKPPDEGGFLIGPAIE
jgi:hypothetical protein